MKNETPAILTAAVDQLAHLKAQICNLQAQESALKQTIAESGFDILEGTSHRAAITHNATRNTINWEALARACIDPELLPELIEDYTTTGEPFDIVRLSAKKTS